MATLKSKPGVIWPLCLFALVMSLVQPSSGAVPSARPNVLFIVIDDLNDWVGFLGGHPQIKTPHMDRLAKQGVVFANAHCAAPLCCPSRAAVFSGQQPFTTGIYHNGPNIRKLHPDKVLLPQYMSAHGYRTFGTGKLLHHSSEGLYDEYFVTEQRWSPLTGEQVDYTPEELLTKPTDPRHVARVGPDRTEVVLPLNRMPSDRNPAGEKAESFDWGPFDVQDDDMGDGEITNWAIERLNRRADKPFFMAVGFYRPHIPLWAPRRYFDLYPEAATSLPAVLGHDLEDLGPTARRWALEPVTAGAHSTVIQHGQWKAAVSAYLACVSFVDAQVGRLLDTLDNSPYRDNTLIVLWGDNGWHLGEKQHWGKSTGWERATRVPLLIVPPRSTGSEDRTGTQCHSPVSLIDLYSTVIDFCRLPEKPELDGHSLRPLLEDPAQKTAPIVITFEYGHYSVRSDRWRLIHYGDGSEELYDHASDPNEWHNLIHDTRYRDVRLSLAAHLPGSAAEALGR